MGTTLAEWSRWRAGRSTSVSAAQGNLALVKTVWLGDGVEVQLDKALEGQPESVTATAISRADFDGTVVARGYRLWDAESPAIRAFDGIETYPYDPAWVVEGTFTQFEGARPVPFEHIRDNGATRDLAVPGEIAVTIDGVDHRLVAFDDSGRLLLVFGDPTNGDETYGSGRFLFVQRDGDRAVLDFNRAFVPPCGFSVHYNCPLPPQQNRLHAAVRAGERFPKFHNEYQAH